MEGFVTKRGHLITNWKVRWFVLDNGEIKYFTDKTLQKLKGRYILRKESIISHHADMGLNKNVLLIFTTSHPFRKKALYFSCESAESRTDWCNAISKQLEALKAGLLAPAAAPTIIASTIQSVDNMASRINNKIVDTITMVRNVAETDTATNDADIEELLRGRPAPRQKPERTLSIDSEASLNTPKPARPVSKGKRLNTTPAVSAHSVATTVEDRETYTAADYDSSDTDGSANEQTSMGSRVRQNSVGFNSAQSAMLAAEAMRSPVFKKRGSEPHSTVLMDESALPRVSTIVADEAAQANQRKVNPSNYPSSTSSSTKAGGIRPIESTAKASTQSSSSSTNAAASTTPRKKSSFTSEDSSWIKSSAPAEPAPSSSSASPAPARTVPSMGAASPVPAATATPPLATAAVPNRTTTDPDNPWIEAYTPEGELYYYHKVSRLARWDKPEAHVAEAVESRMREMDIATERSLRERREDMDKAKQRERDNEQVKDQKTGEIERDVKSWAMDKQRAGRELTFPELLRDLVFILPSDLLLVLYDSNHKVVLDTLQEFTVNSAPAEVKKAYLRVVRFIHPDKLPGDLDTASKLLVERVFIHLTQKYDLYRKAHEL